MRQIKNNIEKALRGSVFSLLLLGAAFMTSCGDGKMVPESDFNELQKKFDAQEAIRKEDEHNFFGAAEGMWPVKGKDGKLEGYILNIQDLHHCLIEKGLKIRQEKESQNEQAESENMDKKKEAEKEAGLGDIQLDDLHSALMDLVFEGGDPSKGIVPTGALGALVGEGARKGGFFHSRKAEHIFLAGGAIELLHRLRKSAQEPEAYKADAVDEHVSQFEDSLSGAPSGLKTVISESMIQADFDSSTVDLLSDKKTREALVALKARIEISKENFGCLKSSFDRVKQLSKENS